MIKRVQIKNFKCYGDPGVDFTLKRINFIFGDNSAGKSTFLQLLRMYFNEMGVVNGKSKLPIDLNYRQYVFRNDVDRTIKLRVSTFNGGEHEEGRNEAYPIYEFISQGGKTSKRYLGYLDYSDIVRGNLDDIHPAGKGASPDPDSEEYLSNPAWYLNDVDGYLPENVVHCEAARPERFSNYAHETSLAQGDFLKSDAIDYVNMFFKSLNLPYECIDTQTLMDLDFGVAVPRRNVGAGIDGLFATALKLFEWKSSAAFDLLELEEPESHLNERQISPLMNWLFHEVNEQVKGQVVVECHSELMALKLKTFIRSGVVSPDDLAILFAEKTPTGTAMHEIVMDDKGNFRTKWPNGGFFTERTKVVDEFFKAKQSR